MSKLITASTLEKRYVPLMSLLSALVIYQNDYVEVMIGWNGAQFTLNLI